jgi:hypothetical protein
VTFSHIELGLMIGPGVPGPAPGSLAAALRRVEVTQADRAPSGFQLTFHAEWSGQGPDEFAIVQNPLLAPLNRVLVRVSVDGVASTLIDGVITHHQFQPGNGPEDPTFVVTGEDLSLLMDLVDYSREFPSLPDGLIVAAVLAPYAALGVLPVFGAALSALVPYDHVPQQASTDRVMVQQLAQANGCVFFVTPGEALYTNTAYWGRRPRLTPPSAAINVAAGPFTNAEATQFTYDALATTRYFGEVMETEVPPYEDVPVLTLVGAQLPPFAATPSPLGREQLWREQQLDPVRANAVAQALTTASASSVVTGQVEVATARLGTVLRAPGVVGVRGTGSSYDGLYYLASATHQISALSEGEWDYRQRLSLSREGLGTTVPALVVP